MNKKQVRGSTTGRPIMVLFDILGKRWTMRILWELKSGRLNFRELREHCDDVSPTVLNQRLKALRELDIVDHNTSGYGLSTWGKELAEQLMELNKWSQKWAKRS